MLYFDNDKFVKNIRTKYNEKGLIPDDLKKASEKGDGVVFKELKDVLNGTSKDELKIKTVIFFANLFNCSINEILGFENSKISSEHLATKNTEPSEPEDIIELIVELKNMKNDIEKFELVKKLIKLLNK